MWLLFHRKAGTKLVADGKTFAERCPTCERTTQFCEVETTEKFGMWFVDLVGDTERAFRCNRCGDVFDLRDQAPAAPAPRAPVAPTVDRSVDRTEALAAEQRRRDAARADARAAIEVRLDDELAALKRKMGK